MAVRKRQHSRPPKFYENSGKLPFFSWKISLLVFLRPNGTNFAPINQIAVRADRIIQEWGTNDMVNEAPVHSSSSKLVKEPTPGPTSKARSSGTMAALTLIAGMLMAPSAHAVIVAGNSSAFASASGSWSWDGAQHAELRVALEDPANFGPAGIVQPQTISTVDLVSIDAPSLAGVDVFVSSYWEEGQSAAFETDIVNWFLGGGDLVLLQDASDRDGISSLLGFVTEDGSDNPTTVSGALGSGPFGSVTTVLQAGQIGHFDNATVLGLGGDILGLNDAGQATIASFSPGLFSPTSGSLLAFADVDLISGLFGGADFGPGINDKGRLALNAFASLSSINASSTAVPEPATVALLAVGLIGIGTVVRRRRQA